MSLIGIGPKLCGVGYVSAPPIRRWTFRRRDYRAPELFFGIYFSVATLFRFVARFACFNRFALNGIQEIACFIVFSSKIEKKIKIGNGAEMSGAETARRPVVQRRIGGAEMAAPKWPSPLENIGRDGRYGFNHLLLQILDIRWFYLWTFTYGGT